MILLKKNSFFELRQTTNIYTTLMPFYGTEYYRQFKDQYTNDPHGIPEPIFVDKRVQMLYETISWFRNKYEDVIYEVNFKLQRALSVKQKINNVDLENLYFISKVQYLAFESMLICCEKFDYCSIDLLDKSKIVEFLVDWGQ